MKKSLIEVIKANKEIIIKKSVIVTGTAIGLFVLQAFVKENRDDEFIELEEYNEEEPIEETEQAE